MKDKIIKLFKQRIDNLTNDTIKNLDMHRGTAYENIGTERVVYCGKDVLGYRKKIFHHLPEHKKIVRILLDEKDDSRIALYPHIDNKFTDGTDEHEDVSVISKFFGWSKIKKIVKRSEYWQETTVSADYKINYGTVEEKITQEEHEELVAYAKSKYDTLWEEHRVISAKKQVKREKEDLARLKKKKL